jgi:hypothetical protein
MVKHHSKPSIKESPLQLRLDFERPAMPESTATSATIHAPESAFALRFAALLEADPLARFDNAAVSRLAQEIFGSAAGHARAAQSWLRGD